MIPFIQAIFKFKFIETGNPTVAARAWEGRENGQSVSDGDRVSVLHGERLWKMAAQPCEHSEHHYTALSLWWAENSVVCVLAQCLKPRSFKFNCILKEYITHSKPITS